MSEQEPTLTTPQASAMMSQRLPKRLIALLIVYTAASISGLVAKQGVLFCLLTLFMVIAIIGRQKAALIMLRGYTLVQLGLISMLPVIMYDPDNLIVGPTTVYLGEWQSRLPDYVIFIALIVLSLLQVWVAFDKKVKAWFKPKLNLNIMS
ncbi:hypothetical protein [Shewanella glacialipiscicola]|uniref:Membrane protein n=1 Tax=Shewanella glacialipiscicola TaxID=614069 RepID=A0ABQ6J6Q0_9GAMM|nr:hypothetical protein [Shewanella glacialipiscicola]MCL1085068.1 hypothetical protein [Shewanella glacialipiscicola]GIU15477.1 membrane protein [Shewanella glacialipiscicola]GMA82955.1 membrane protein [Shewanella glacialipiscicola]